MARRQEFLVKTGGPFLQAGLRCQPLHPHRLHPCPPPPARAANAKPVEWETLLYLSPRGIRDITAQYDGRLR